MLPDETHQHSRCINPAPHTFACDHAASFGTGKGGCCNAMTNDKNARNVVAQEIGICGQKLNFHSCISDNDCCMDDCCSLETSLCHPPTFGHEKSLVLRARALDHSETSSVDEASDHVFGANGKPFAVPSQFHDCSCDQLTANPCKMTSVFCRVPCLHSCRMSTILMQLVLCRTHNMSL